MRLAVKVIFSSKYALVFIHAAVANIRRVTELVTKLFFKIFT
jgi:hypothetical protein